MQWFFFLKRNLRCLTQVLALLSWPALVYVWLSTGRSRLVLFVTWLLPCWLTSAFALLVWEPVIHPANEIHNYHNYHNFHHHDGLRLRQHHRSSFINWYTLTLKRQSLSTTILYSGSRTLTRTIMIHLLIISSVLKTQIISAHPSNLRMYYRLSWSHIT